jgi:hypothetical protein
MRRWFADRLVLATAVVVLVMALGFAVWRVSA